MSLPLEQEMAIHLAYLEHRAAVAEGFAKLRAKLLPEVVSPTLAGLLQAALSTSPFTRNQAWLQAQMAQGQLITTGHITNPFQAAAMANPMHGMRSPLGGLAWLFGV